MKSKIFTIICILLFIAGIITTAEAKTTYKINKNGTIQTGGRATSSKVPKWTPTDPSGVANKPSTKNKTKYKKYEEMDAKPLFKSWTTIKAYNTINTVGTRLLEASDINEDIVFSVKSGREANAYTNVADEIVLYTGILKYVETEDELAAIIGHELGHVLNNDVRRSIARQVLLNVAGVPRTVVSKKDRNDEYRADLTGADLMVNAQYNPLAEISILNKISGHYVDITSSHPTGRKRLRALYDYICKNYPQYVQNGYPTVSYQRALMILGEE